MPQEKLTRLSVKSLPAKGVVEFFEIWLARAKNGDVRAVALAAIVISNRGREESTCESICEKWVWRDTLLGALFRLLTSTAHSINNRHDG
jgi:hypothetical protein